MPRWATLGLTLEAGDLGWIGLFAAAAAACDVRPAELAGDDTTCGPGRATVFALGAESLLSRRTVSRPHMAIPDEYPSIIGNLWQNAPAIYLN